MKPRKKIKIKEADNGFIVECYSDNVLDAMPLKIKVFRDKKELTEYITMYFSSKELENINSTALQDEEMEDEGEY